jgi:hypothetical protein
VIFILHILLLVEDALSDAYFTSQIMIMKNMLPSAIYDDPIVKIYPSPILQVKLRSAIKVNFFFRHNFLRPSFLGR